MNGAVALALDCLPCDSVVLTAISKNQLFRAPSLLPFLVPSARSYQHVDFANPKFPNASRLRNHLARFGIPDRHVRCRLSGPMARWVDVFWRSVKDVQASTHCAASPEPSRGADCAAV